MSTVPARRKMLVPPKHRWRSPPDSYHLFQPRLYLLVSQPVKEGPVASYQRGSSGRRRNYHAADRV